MSASHFLFGRLALSFEICHNNPISELFSICMDGFFKYQRREVSRMKNFFRILGVIAIVLVIGFTMASCGDGGDGGDDDGDGNGNGGGSTGGGGNTDISLNGAWVRVSDSGEVSSNGTVDTIIDGNAYFTKIEGGWQKVMEKGGIKIGSLHYRNITKTGDRTWSAQAQTYNQSTFVLLDWVNGTITLSADGQSFVGDFTSGGSTKATYNRVQSNELEGAWVRVSDSGSVNSNGTVDTIIGNTAYFTKIEGAWQKVMENGWINIGSPHYKIISKTGDRTWSAQAQTFNQSTYVLLDWVNGTITLSADGQSFVGDFTSNGSTKATYNRVR